MNKKKFNFKQFSRLIQYVIPYKFNFIFVSVAAILISFFSIANQYLLKIAVDDFIAPANYEGFIFIISLMIVVLAFQVIFQFLFVYFTNLLGQKVVFDIRNILFKKIISFKMSYYNKSSVGRLVTRTVNDMETIASIFSQGLFMIIADLILMISVLTVMIVLSFKLSFIIFLVLPFILLATRLFQIAMKAAFSKVRDEVANLNSFVQERLSGMKEIQIFNRQIIEYRNFKKINERHKKAWLKTVWYNSIFFPISEISTSITIGLVVWYAGFNNLTLDKPITLGTIFLFIQLSQMLFRPLRQIADKFNTLQMGMVAADRVFNILDTDELIDDGGKIESKKIIGDIRFKNISFYYEKGNPIIENLSFHIKKGERIAIVGPTGAGKSTLIKLILRLFECQTGQILIDGIKINKFSLKNLRSQISLVSQDIFLFADSVYNNISLFNKEISIKEVEKAAKEIGVLSFIKTLPGGFKYNIKERGVMLSEGQRQLVSFLRSYVSKPKILILDEATSSIDTKTETLIQYATNKIIDGKTSIIIAHRLSTILNADRILFLENGKIKECGNHNQLMALENGNYRKLVENELNCSKSVQKVI